MNQHSYELAIERQVEWILKKLEEQEYETVIVERNDSFIIFSVPASEQAKARLNMEERFVQFAFCERGFYMDLPDTTLLPEDAERILEERPDHGFEYALNRSQITITEQKFDPLQIIYAYPELRIAAMDTAYILYDIYGTDPEVEIQVKSAQFGKGGASW